MVYLILLLVRLSYSTASINTIHIIPGALLLQLVVGAAWYPFHQVLQLLEPIFPHDSYSSMLSVVLVVQHPSLVVFVFNFVRSSRYIYAQR